MEAGGGALAGVRGQGFSLIETVSRNMPRSDNRDRGVRAPENATPPRCPVVFDVIVPCFAPWQSPQPRVPRLASSRFDPLRHKLVTFSLALHGRSVGHSSPLLGLACWYVALLPSSIGIVDIANISSLQKGTNR